MAIPDGLRARLRSGVAAACGLALLAVPAGAEVFDDAGVAAPFLKIGQGARAAAMGEAFTAVADDSTAVFWNPAGLAQVQSIQAQFTLNRWISDFRQSYLGAVVPIAGAWGLGWSFIDLGKFDEIDGGGNATGNSFTVNDQCLMIGYARGFQNDAILVGVAGKTVKEDLGGGVTGQTTAFDFGMIGLPLWDDPRVALAGVIENIGGELSGFELPLAVRLGASLRRTGLLFDRPLAGSRESLEDVSRAYSRYPWEIRGSTSDSLTVAADMRIPRRGRLEVHGGMEYWISFVALRVGYRYRFPRNELGGLSGLTVGFGLRGHGFQFDYGFDYSYAPMGELGNASRFTVSVGF